MTRLAPSAALVGLLLLAACGDSGARSEAASSGATTADQRPAAVDACAAVPSSEVARILGGPVNPAEPGQPFESSEGSHSTCGWRTADNGAGLILSIRSSPNYRPDVSAFDRYADGMEENLGTRPRVQSVTGLGSAALWDQTNHILIVRADRPGYEVSVQPYSSTRVPMVELDVAQALARETLGRLP